MHAALADDLAIEQRLIVVIDLDEHHRRPRRGRHFGTVGAHAGKIGPLLAVARFAIARRDVEIAIAALPVNLLPAVGVALEARQDDATVRRSEEHTSELTSLMRI